MTEAIKQWIADQGETYPNVRGRKDYSAGLTKGIEIAEGFAEWIALHNIQKSTIPNCYAYEGQTFTTSRLLERYLQHLSSLNKEK